MTVPFSVIVLGVDNPMGLAVVRDLGRHGARVIGLGRSLSALGLQSRWCHRSVIRETGSDCLLRQIEELADTYDCAVLLTISESDIQWINDHRSRLETRLRCAVPSPEIMAVVLDKARSQDLAVDLGIEVPMTCIVDPAVPLNDQITELSYPVVLKWANPHDVKGALNRAGLKLKKYEYSYDRQDLLNKLLPYKEVGQFPLIQEYVPGYGLGHFFLVRDGRVLLRFQHRRLHEWPPDGGVSTLCESLSLDDHSEALARSEALIRKLDWEGVAMVEYRYDPDTGRYVFMEVNGRFWGSLPLAIAAGVPFAWGLATPDPASLARANDYRPSVKARFFVPDLRRLMRLLFQPHLIENKALKVNRLAEVLRFVCLYLDPKVRYFVFQWQDQKPFWVDLVAMIRKVLRRLFRK